MQLRYKILCNRAVFRKSPIQLDNQQLVTSITAGLVAGLIVIVFCISLAALIFSGEMSDYVSRGIGLFLFGGFVMSVLLSIVGTFPGTAIGPQDGPAALVAVAASGIVASIAGTPASVFSTVVATIMLCSFATGILFFLIGTFKLGNLVRYIPYPVVGGFLAGISPSIAVMIWQTLSINALVNLRRLLITGGVGFDHFFF